MNSILNSLERFEEMSRVEDLIEQNPKDGKKVFAYISNPAKTQLVSGVNCSPETANEEMLLTKRTYNKLSGRQFVHFVQSFSPEEKVTPETVHEIGLRLAQFEGFKGFQMVIATHIDAKHLHNHFVINTVNSITGRKWQQSPKGMQQLKEYSDQICQEYGLSVIPWKNQDRKPPGEYRADKRGDSWKNELRLAVTECIRNSTSQSEFIANLGRLGYKVDWTDTRKYITFTTPEGMKCRNIRLGQDFDKEKILKELELNNRHSNHDELRKAMDLVIEIAKLPVRGVRSNEQLVNRSKYLWKTELQLVVRQCLQNSTTRKEFVNNMNRLGYKVDWTDTRKYITFTTPEGMKCRNVRLGPEFNKEKMLAELKLNKQNCDHKDLRETMDSLVKILQKPEQHINKSETSNNFWRHQLRLAVRGSLRSSITKEEFVTNMKRLGYEVDWRDNSSHIWIKTADGKKCKSDYLGKKYMKDIIIQTIKTNKEYVDSRIAQARMELTLELINFLSHRVNQDDHKRRYPISAALEGQALKDKIAEEQLSGGLDWDKGEGYER